jgi:hypothetical protein
VRWGLVAFALTMLAAIVAICIWFRNPAAPITRSAFEDARRRWEESQIADYDVEIEVQGRQAAVYRVRVRNNRVASALRNGYPLKQRRTQGTWSVPGMFDTIEADLENVESARREGAAQKLLLRAVFDSKLGYPSYYHRGELGGDDVVWRVRRFVAHGRRVELVRSQLASPCFITLRFARRSYRFTSIAGSPP